MARSVLDDLGEEITGIIAPVSICMALVVVLVKALNPDGITDSSTVAIATLAYHEQVCGICAGLQYIYICMTDMEAAQVPRHLQQDTGRAGHSREHGNGTDTACHVVSCGLPQHYACSACHVLQGIGVA